MHVIASPIGSKVESHIGQKMAWETNMGFYGSKRDALLGDAMAAYQRHMVWIPFQPQAKQVIKNQSVFDVWMRTDFKAHHLSHSSF